MNPPTVLIAEDNPTVARMLALILRSSGFSPLVALDGLTAWRDFQAQLPDAVLSDQEMPGLTGLQLCQKIRETERGRTVPFLLVTGRQAELEGSEIIHSLRIDALFGKPFCSTALADTLRNLLAMAVR